MKVPVIGFLITTATLVGAPAVRADLAGCEKCIENADIADKAVTSRAIRNGAVKGPDLAADSVTSTKIKNGTIRSADIRNGSIRTRDLGNGSVSLQKLDDDVKAVGLDGAVTVPAAAFSVRNSDADGVFFDRNGGYLIPTNPTRSFCSQAPALLPDSAELLSMVVYFYDNSAADFDIAVKTNTLEFGTAPSAASVLASVSTSQCSVGDPTLLKACQFYAGPNTPTFVHRVNTPVWVEVCMSGDGVNARNMRFYGVTINFK